MTIKSHRIVAPSLAPDIHSVNLASVLRCQSDNYLTQIMISNCNLYYKIL